MTLTFKSLYLNMVAVIHSLVATNGRQTVSLEKGVFCHWGMRGILFPRYSKAIGPVWLEVNNRFFTCIAGYATPLHLVAK